MAKPTDTIMDVKKISMDFIMGLPIAPQQGNDAIGKMTFFNPSYFIVFFYTRNLTLSSV